MDGSGNQHVQSQMISHKEHASRKKIKINAEKAHK